MPISTKNQPTDERYNKGITTVKQAPKKDDKKNILPFSRRIKAVVFKIIRFMNKFSRKTYSMTIFIPSFYENYVKCTYKKIEKKSKICSLFVRYFY